MNILAFDTSFAAVSVCVAQGPQVRAWRRIDTTRNHAELLLPMIAAVLAEAGLTMADIQRIATTRGPGHFTGLRAGLAAAQGLAAASTADLVGFDAFATVAAQMEAPRAGERRLIAFDSKRSEAFIQIDSDAPFACADTGPSAAGFSASGSAFLVGGDRADAFAAALVAAGKSVRVDAAAPLPDARTLAVLARDATPSGDLVPLYIHPPATSVPKRP